MDGRHRSVVLWNTILTSIMVIVVIIVIAFTYIGYSITKGAEHEAFTEVARVTTNQVSNSLNKWLDSQIKIAKLVAKEPLIIEALTYPYDEEKVIEAKLYLDRIYGIYNQFESFPISSTYDKGILRTINGEEVLIRPNTFLTSPHGETLAGKGGRGWSYVDNVINRDVEYYISEIYKSLRRNNPIFVIAIPVYNRDDMVGIVYNSPKLDYFADVFVMGSKVKDTGYMFFVDDKANIIAHKDKSLILSDENFSTGGKEILNRVISAEEEFIDEYGGIEKAYYSTKFKTHYSNMKSQWYMVFTMEESEIHEKSEKLKWVLMFLLAVMLTALLVSFRVLLSSSSKKLESELLKEDKARLEEEVKKRTRQLEILATTDGLSGLLNHVTGYEKLRESLTRSEVSLIMCDIDNFKYINDTYGHPGGDEVIKGCARFIEKHTRECDILCRYGGEEFIIILPETKLEEATEIAERIRLAMEDATFSNELIKITLSFGVCIYGGESAENLVSRADKLLYKAKENGKNRVESETLVM